MVGSIVVGAEQAGDAGPESDVDLRHGHLRTEELRDTQGADGGGWLKLTGVFAGGVLLAAWALRRRDAV